MKAHPNILVRMSPPTPSTLYEKFWYFAAERQRIFFARFRHDAPPWTEDPIINRHRFTNAYRASDRVSQYLIANVIYEGSQEPEEVFFRTVLFKLFNKPATWQSLNSRLGPLSWKVYEFRLFDRVLTHLKHEGESIYSAAYIMPSAMVFGHKAKHRNHLRLLESMMSDEVPGRLSECGGMGDAFRILLGYPSIGPFLAYQLVTDLNYSGFLRFSEMEFVEPGPGALSGISKCFQSYGSLAPTDIIQLVTDRQETDASAFGADFRTLWGRPLQLIDVQNLFCEIDKYSRVSHPEITGKSRRVRIKQVYKDGNQDPIQYWYPPKWGINRVIPRSV